VRWSALALTASAMLVVGCQATIEPDRAAALVADFIRSRSGYEVTDLTCPDNIEASVGTTFECRFTGPDGAPHVARVRVAEVSGGDVNFYIETHPT